MALTVEDVDFEGTGNFAEASPVGRRAKQVRLTLPHRFGKPGTYFAGLRGVSQRQGNATSPYGRIRNLGRVRVVVK